MNLLPQAKYHGSAIALAALAALTMAMPQLSFRLEYQGTPLYQGIELLPDSPWSPRVREVMDGHPTLGNIYFKDGKNDPYLFQPLGSIVIGSLGKALGLDINDTLLYVSRLLLTFVAVLLIYGFIYLFARNRLASLLAAAAITFTDPVLNALGLKNLLTGAFPGHFLGLSFPVNNAMLFIPLFGFLIAFWLFYTKRDWRYGVASALLLGLNFYNYFYSWTYLYAFGAFLVLLYLLRREWREALRIGSVFAGALLVAIPYGINLYRASTYSSYADVGMRFGIIPTHEPLWIGFLPLAAILAFFLWFPKENRERYLFGLALLLAPILTMNQQVLTGKEMQAAHYHWYFHKPVALLFGVLVAAALFKRFKRFRTFKVLAIAGILLSISIGVFTQVTAYEEHGRYGREATLERQRYGSMLAWLNENARAEEVVLATDEPSHLVTIYTSLNVFYHRAGYASLAATKERLFDTLITFYRLRGVTSAEAERVFSDERAYISANIYGIYYRQVRGSYEAIPDEKIDELVQAYLVSLATPAVEWLKGKLAQYEVSYIVWDKGKDPSWQLERYPFLKEAATFGALTVYRFSP